ncbi:hypothetical protein C1T31_07980 [Hanstruepera neustonica]|uniref:LamG-like jellyroll fold domain-containing protein n=1 Tax=Hanstruepera neustonica TaxID=1445657 RepID=A0A2K1DZI5_9FLAO|nr:LamG domain-containing protein [Hanstruepera neustonica]PNQ73438.1 hypothetical protein C1T31_07980 [Hanstruepera neustonica]
MKFRLSLFLLLMLLFVGVSCQEEANEETPPNQEETIAPNSTLANLMRHTAANDGTIDNIMDGSDCFSVNLPVTIIANGITLTIESIDDFSLIEAIFDENNTNEDTIEFLFPITIILNDYTEITIETLEELDAFIESCVVNEEVIECVDFVYPIIFSIYNTNFQIIDTVEINNDYELYVFLEGLETDNQGAVLASLNFPVTLVYANGDTVEVNGNQELEEAINAANENCEDDIIVDCGMNLAELEAHLVECDMVGYTFNVAGDAIDENYLNFNSNGEVIVNGTPAVTEVASWVLTESNSGYILTIAGLETFNLLNGEWSLLGCERDRIVFTQGEGDNTITLELEQDCSGNETPFDCFGNTTVTACDFDNDGFATFELETLVLGNVICDVDFTPSFHISQTNAEADVNPIAEPNAFVNTTNPQTVYLRIEALNGDFEVFTIELVVEDCSSSCPEQEVDAYLVECIWNVVDFDNSNDLAVYDLDFNADGTVVITGNGLTIVSMWSTSQTGAGTIVEFSNVAGPDIQAITGSWVIVDCRDDRLVMQAVNSNSTMVMEQDCSNCDNPGVLTNDLVIYIPFGGEAQDLITGDVVQNITNDFVTDRAGNTTCAIGFTGNDNISIPVTAENQIVQGDSFSISVWFKMQNTVAGDLEIFFRKPGNATVGFNLGVYDLNTPLFGDNLGTTLWDNDWNQEVDVTWDNTDWHHLTVTVDSNNTVRLYRDGALRNVVENSNLTIGSDPTSEYLIGEGFQGHLDDLRVYKRTLSDNEVGDLYNLEADCFQCLE